jgi:hypothetical protein
MYRWSTLLFRDIIIINNNSIPVDWLDYRPGLLESIGDWSDCRPGSSASTGGWKGRITTRVSIAASGLSHESQLISPFSVTCGLVGL